MPKKNRNAPSLGKVLEIAKDHLRQYRRYECEMCKIGKGLEISSAYTPEMLAVMIEDLLLRMGK
jgi:hypothetical protein